MKWNRCDLCVFVFEDNFVRQKVDVSQLQRHCVQILRVKIVRFLPLKTTTTQLKKCVRAYILFDCCRWLDIIEFLCVYLKEILAQNLYAGCRLSKTRTISIQNSCVLIFPDNIFCLEFVHVCCNSTYCQFENNHGLRKVLKFWPTKSEMRKRSGKCSSLAQIGSVHYVAHYKKYVFKNCEFESNADLPLLCGLFLLPNCDCVKRRAPMLCL